MPPKHKKQSATLRDRRHENGLAPPVKQVKKQKSDGNINGHAAQLAPGTHVASASSQLPDPSASRLDDSAATGQFASSNMAPGHTFPLAAIDHRSPNVTTSDGAHASVGVGNAEGSIPSVTPYPEYLDHAMGKQTQSIISNTASTVIAQLSPLDVIAILLVLMQLPYSVLAVFHVCFAFLTFGSPPTGWSFSSIFSATDWLQSHGGSPSIVTMTLVDAIFFGLWCLLPLGKDFTLDLAQAVVAISLGGGTSGGSGRTQGVFCFGIVAIHHMLGQKLWNTRHYLLAGFCSLLNMLTVNTTFGPFDPDDILDALDVCPDTDRSWPRILLELHIVTQGVVRIIRRWFIRPSMQKLTARKGESDPRYIPPDSPSIPLNAVHQDVGRNPSGDGRHPGPSPAGREGGREKSISIVKKKRKQATFVRSQQPFWAAIANTKVTVSKEIEQSHASQDSEEAGSSSVEHLGSSINQCRNFCVWITDIQDTEIRFKALYLRQKEPSQESDLQVDLQSSVVVLINGAEWASTALVPDGSRDGDSLLSGKIFGLTSLTNYMIQFVKATDRSLIQTIKLVTRPDETVDQAPPEGPFRPSSPTSTLKKSIGAAESNLAEHRNRSKRCKRDHRNSINALKKEIDIVEGRLSSCGGNDERQRQRQFQYRQNIKQADESVSTIAEEIQSLGDIPQEERQATNNSKEQWSVKKKAHAAFRGEVESSKTNATRQLNTARSEMTQLQQKQERLSARLAKLHTQREGLVAQNEQDQQDQKRRDQSRIDEMTRAANEERTLQSHLRYLENQRLNAVEQYNQMEHQLQYLETVNAPSDMMPQTPEATHSSLAFGRATGLPGLGPVASQQPIGTPPVHSRRSSLMKTTQNRVRSSSMLSNVSGFTDDEITLTHPPNGTHTIAGSNLGREGSVGSGGSGSVRPSSKRASTSPKVPVKPNPIGAERERERARDSPRNSRT